MFGFKKNKNSDGDTTRHPQRPAGLPMDLYASYEIDDVKFHDKNAKWYKATEVDSLLDKIKQTLEWHEKREAAIGDTTEEDRPVPSVDDQSLSIPTPLADAVDKINDEINSGSSNDTDDYNYDLWRQSDYQEDKKTAGLTGVLSPTDIALRTASSHATENNAAIMNGDRYIAQPESGDQVTSLENNNSVNDNEDLTNKPVEDKQSSSLLNGEASVTQSSETFTIRPVVPELSPVDVQKATVNPFLRH